MNFMSVDVVITWIIKNDYFIVKNQKSNEILCETVLLFSFAVIRNKY